MVKDILTLGLKNIVGVPLLQTQSQLIGDVTDAPSRSILRAGVAVQAVGLVGENVKVSTKKLADIGNDSGKKKRGSTL